MNTLKTYIVEDTNETLYRIVDSTPLTSSALQCDIKSVWLDVSIFLPRHLVLSPTLSSHNLVTNTMRTLSLSATNKTKQYPEPS